MVGRGRKVCLRGSWWWGGLRQPDFARRSGVDRLPHGFCGDEMSRKI